MSLVTLKFCPSTRVPRTPFEKVSTKVSKLVLSLVDVLRRPVFGGETLPLVDKKLDSVCEKSAIVELDAPAR